MLYKSRAELSQLNRMSPPDAKIALFRSLFRGREDVYARRCRGYEMIGYRIVLPHNIWVTAKPTGATAPKTCACRSMDSWWCAYWLKTCANGLILCLIPYFGRLPIVVSGKVRQAIQLFDFALNSSNSGRTFPKKSGAIISKSENKGDASLTGVPESEKVVSSAGSAKMAVQPKTGKENRHES